MKQFKIIIVLVFLVASLAAENNAVDFVHTGLSSRALSMGNSYTAAGGGLDGIFFNPASLALMDGEYEFCSAGVNNFDMVERKNIGAALNGQKLGLGAEDVLGFTLSNQQITDIPRVSWGDNDRPVQTGLFSDEKYCYTLTYSKSENEYFAYGLNLRNYSYKLAEYTANGLGLDAGARFRLPENYFDSPIVIGATLHNIFRTKIIWSTGHQDTIPMRVGLGAAMYRTIFERKLILSTELEQEEDMPIVLKCGTELWLVNNCLALRTGLDGKLLTLGLGIIYDDLSLDYAQADYEDLGLVRRISVNIKF